MSGDRDGGGLGGLGVGGGGAGSLGGLSFMTASRRQVHPPQQGLEARVNLFLVVDSLAVPSGKIPLLP